jgi:hypothetical protein
MNLLLLCILCLLFSPNFQKDEFIVCIMKFMATFYNSHKGEIL